MELIALKDICFGWGGNGRVLDGLGFNLSEGQRVGISGANGAGKSTMFQIIMGLVSPSRGRVELLGRVMEGEADFAAARPKMGYCFQDADDQLFCPTVLEDVAFGPMNLGLNAHQARHAAEAALATVGLAGFGKRVTYNLSGGEKRLVSLATVLAMGPKALLLDEPTTGLDEDSQARIEQVLLASDIPFAVISHDKGFLARVCKSRLHLEGGRLGPA